MRKWTTNATAAADTRISKLERWCVERGYFNVANWLAARRVRRKK